MSIKEYLLLSSIKSKNDSSITTLVLEDLFNTLIKNSLDTNCPVGLLGLQMKSISILLSIASKNPSSNLKFSLFNL